MKTMYPELNPDLSFQPVRGRTPRWLTPVQIAEYNAQGYLAPIPLFEGDRLEEIQAFFNGAKTRLTSYSQFEAFHHAIPELYDLVTDGRMTGYLQDLLGPNVVCHTSQYICKEPGDARRVVWHQDASFNPMDARCVIVWMAIDDARVENGCMWFIPGSHRLGGLDCLAAGHEVPEAERYGAKVPVELKAGEAVFFSDLLLHSSPPNTSRSLRRGGLTATYAPAELVPVLGRKTWAVLCSGEDAGGHWQIQPRPPGGPLVSAAEGGPK